MGRRTILPKFQVFNAANTASSPESLVSEVAGVDSITYEIEIGAAVNAIIAVLFCNDAKISSASVFRPLEFKQTLSMVGSTDTSGMVHVKNMGFRHMKLKVTNNGGTGNISAWVSGTVEGA